MNIFDEIICSLEHNVAEDCFFADEAKVFNWLDEQAKDSQKGIFLNLLEINEAVRYRFFPYSNLRVRFILKISQKYLAVKDYDEILTFGLHVSDASTIKIWLSSLNEICGYEYLFNRLIKNIPIEPIAISNAIYHLSSLCVGEKTERVEELFSKLLYTCAKYNGEIEIPASWKVDHFQQLYSSASIRQREFINGRLTVNAIGKISRVNQYETIPKTMTVGVDIDGSIMKKPAFFAFLSQSLKASGHKLLIITFREDYVNLVKLLRKNEIEYTEIISSSFEDQMKVGVDEWKAEVCKRYQVDVLFDGSPSVMKHIEPETLALMSIDNDSYDLGKLL